MIYLMKSAHYKQGKAFYKIGFTQNIDKRLTYYITHNPTIQVLELVDTYSKTKHRLETMLHNELIKQGYKFEVIDDIATEWFEADIDSITLTRFKACKHRKVITLP